MSRIRHLSRPPIVEAVVDIRVETSPGVLPESFLSVPEEFKRRFPERREQKVLSSRLRLDADEGMIPDGPSDASVHGYRYAAPQGKRIAQFRVNGFTFNMLHPYSAWTDLIKEAREGWEIYRGLAEPRSVTRIAVRYINRFDVTPPTVLSHVFEISPELPEPIPQEVSRVLWRWELGDGDTEIRTHLTVASEPVVDPGKVRFLLDIDSFLFRVFDTDSEEVWEGFEELHAMKNRIFFYSLTESILERFE